jgi:hypothetical protein
MLKNRALKRGRSSWLDVLFRERPPRKQWARMRLSVMRGRGRRARSVAAASWIALSVVFPSLAEATHEADHRFIVEGYVCGADGKPAVDVDVLVKDTKISSGQIVKTDGYGYYKATFHLHNDNLGDPLLVEARGEQQNHKVQFDPKDLEAERKIQVNFGTGCDANSPPAWLWWGGGALVAAVGGIVAMKLARLQRKQERAKGKSQGKRKV